AGVAERGAAERRRFDLRDLDPDDAGGGDRGYGEQGAADRGRQEQGGRGTWISRHRRLLVGSRGPDPRSGRAACRGVADGSARLGAVLEVLDEGVLTTT